jgi:heme exporter protein D
VDKLLTAEFWQMGGYAFYVWSSFGVALLVFVWNGLAPLMRRRELLSRETRDLRS